MTLNELLKVRRVKTLKGLVMTVLPWARHLNHCRCSYCSAPDSHDLRRLPAQCTLCGSALIRAQDELVEYDAAVDNRLRGLGAEAT
eukprot:10022061-Heterocapsa_arctica.AAC.1